MKMKLLLAAYAVALFATPAIADEPAACLRIGQIWNWHAPDNQTVIVENDSHQKFKLGLMGFCQGLNFRQTLAFKSIGGTDLSCLTAGDEVFTHVMSMRQVCPIKTIELYTPDMEKADKDAAAAKHD